jgi:hypothetical protein
MTKEIKEERIRQIKAEKQRLISVRNGSFITPLLAEFEKALDNNTKRVKKEIVEKLEKMKKETGFYARTPQELEDKDKVHQENKIINYTLDQAIKAIK